MQCSECAAGTYADTVGTDTCTTCPAHSYVSETGSDDKTDCACNAGFVGVDIDSCAACPPGQFEENDECVTCADGTYSLSASGSADDCIQCGDNSQSSSDRSQCLCNAGHRCRLPYINIRVGPGAAAPGSNVELDGISTAKMGIGEGFDGQLPTISGVIWGKGETYAFFIHDFIKEAYDVETIDEFPLCIHGSAQEQVANFGACRVPMYSADNDIDGCEFGSGTADSNCVKDLCMEFRADRVYPFDGPHFGFNSGKCTTSLIMLFKNTRFASMQFLRYFYESETHNTIGVSDKIDWLMWPIPNANHWGFPMDNAHWGNHMTAWGSNNYFYSRESEACINGDCAACPVDTYKPTVGAVACTACPQFAQSLEASTQEHDCKCNRGYIRDDTGTELTCAACLPGKYSHDYQFDSNGDDTNDLDAIICEGCGDYHHTETHHPATNPDECQECFGACGNNQFWESGCLIDGYVDNGNNRDFECGNCPVGLSGTDTASVDNDNNRGPGACVCLPGAYYSEEPYPSIDQVVDLSINLARTCSNLQNGYCANQIETDSTDSDDYQFGSMSGVYCSGTSGGIQGRANILGIGNDGGTYMNCRGDSTGKTACPTQFCKTSEEAKYLTITLDDVMTAIPVLLVDINVATAADKVELWLIDINGDETRANLQQHPYIDGGFIKFELQPQQTAKQIKFLWPAQDTAFKVSWLREVRIFGPQRRDPGCDYCPAGKYKEAFATFVDGSNDEYMQCDDCPEFKSTGTPGADSISNCACQAGYAFDEDAGCVACAAGYFKNAVQDGTCTECDSVDLNSGSWDAAGTTQVTAQSACTCDAGYEPVGGVCTQCQPGKFKAAGGNAECAECSAGTYQSDAGQVQCEACQSHSQSEDGATVCTCNAGYQNADDGGDLPTFSPTGHSCMQCPSQTFKPQTSVLQCQACDQSCGIRDGIPYHITAACTTTSQMQCSPCQQCDEGQYAETECVHADNSALQDTVCVICPAGYYCPIANYFQADAVQCLNGATSPEGSLSEDDCGCVPGEYVDMENGIDECTRCTGDVWCLDGQRRDCPVHSSIVLQDNTIDQLTDHSNIVSCMCHAGYYRDPTFIEPAEPSLDDTFECLLCTSNVDGSLVDNTYCQNNLQQTCQDPNQHTGNVLVENFNDPSDCKCIAGYYFNEDDEQCQLCPKDKYCPHLDDQAYDCPNTRNTKNQPGMSSVEHCTCQAGYFNENAMVGVDMLDTECRECSKNFFCIGNDNQQHECTADSTAPELSVSASACICNAGFGCNSDTTCPGTESVIFLGECVQCQTVAETELVGGQYKSLPGNTACTACLSCTDTVQYASTQCTPTSDRKCMPCNPCGEDFFEVKPCRATRDVECMQCDEDCAITEYEEQGCGGTENRICSPIDTATLCNSGQYRKAPLQPATSDSNCTNCALPNAIDYYGTTLHIFTGPGQAYDDETSCAFVCTDNSILRDKFDTSRGCVSCDTIVHDFMLKDINTRHETVMFHGTEVSLPTECLWTCKVGYEQHGDDCRAMPGTQVMDNRFAVRSVARSTGVEGFVFDLQFSNVNRHVVGVGAAASTCSPRSPFPTASSCCFKDIYRLTSSESMGAGPQIVDSVESTHPLIQYCARPATDIVGLQIDTVDNTDAQMLTLTVPDTALEHVSVCEYVAGTQHCTLTFTYIDVLLRQQVSQLVEISTRHNAAATMVWRHQQYIPLSNFYFAALYIKAENALSIYDCVIDVELSAAILAQHDLRLSIDVYAVPRDAPAPAVWNTLPSMQFSEDYSTSCDRYAAQTSLATASRPHGRAISLLEEHTSWRTRWHVNTISPISALHAVVTITRVHAAAELYVGVLHMTRNLVNQQPICADILHQTVITTATAQVGVGFTPQMQQMPVAVDATSAQDQGTVRIVASGVAGQLLTAFIAGPPHTPCRIERIHVFALHLLTHLVGSSTDVQETVKTISVDALTFTTYDVAGTLQQGTASDFSPAIRQWCRTNSNLCYLEVLSSNSKHVHVQDNCAHESQNTAAKRWLWTKFGYGPVQEYTTQACFRLNNEYKKAPSRLVMFGKLRAEAPAHFQIKSDSASVTTLIWLTARVQT